MAKRTFKAKLERPEGIGTWTYLTVPFDAMREYGGKGQIKVYGTINRVAYRSTLLPHGDGKHFLVVKKEVRDKIGATAGDTVSVSMEQDSKPRTVSVPNDFKLALGRNKKAKAKFDRIPYSHKKEYVDYIDEAKKDETRKRRIKESVVRLASTAKSRPSE